jgi:hypothetical protein
MAMVLSRACPIHLQELSYRLWMWHKLIAYLNDQPGSHEALGVVLWRYHYDHRN